MRKQSQKKFYTDGFISPNRSAEITSSQSEAAQTPMTREDRWPEPRLVWTEPTENITSTVGTHTPHKPFSYIYILYVYTLENGGAVMFPRWKKWCSDTRTHTYKPVLKYLMGEPLTAQHSRNPDVYEGCWTEKWSHLLFLTQIQVTAARPFSRSTGKTSTIHNKPFHLFSSIYQEVMILLFPAVRMLEFISMLK